MLVDTGLAFESEQFVERLREVIDPAELRWIWLTHDDADHTGSLQQLMELAQCAARDERQVRNAHVDVWPVPMEQALRPINPGERLQVGDRTSTAVRPPLFDNPMSIGVVRRQERHRLLVRAFGAIVPRPVERAEDSRGGGRWCGA